MRSVPHLAELGRAAQACLSQALRCGQPSNVNLLTMTISSTISAIAVVAIIADEVFSKGAQSAALVGAIVLGDVEREEGCALGTKFQASADNCLGGAHSRQGGRQVQVGYENMEDVRRTS